MMDWNLLVAVGNLSPPQEKLRQSPINRVVKFNFSTLYFSFNVKRCNQMFSMRPKVIAIREKSIHSTNVNQSN